MNRLVGGAQDATLLLDDGLGNAANSDFEILWFALDADKLSAKLDAGNAGCPAAHEWVEDRISLPQFGPASSALQPMASELDDQPVLRLWS